tara:strand:+ start:92 stop:1765 length:1674 start_codon:yes stop_codon:yes gene_type:complete
MNDTDGKKFFLEGIEHYKNRDFFFAENKFEKALELNPNRISILENLAIVYFENNKFHKCEDILNRLIELGKDSIQIFILKFKTLKKLDEIKKLKLHINNNLQSKDLKPKYKIIHDFLYPLFFEDQSNIDKTRLEFNSSLDEHIKRNKIELTIDGDIINPPIFNLSYDQYENLELNKKIVILYRKIYPELNQNFVKTNYNKKIKIGFISEFFTNHTIGKLYQGIIFKLDQSKFEIVIFHSNNTKKSIIFDQFKRAEITHNIKNIILPNKFQEKINIIDKENLDITFFPDIGMSTEFYFLSYIKFTKAQFTSWGHPITTGNDSIDYFLSSKLLETENAQKRFSEQLILSDYLPMYFYTPTSPKTLIDKQLTIKNKYFCSQNLIKVHPHFDEVISKILKEDKKAEVIFIKDKDEIISKKLFNRFKKNISSNYERITFLNKMSLENYIKLCGRSSVLLDTLYFGAGNSFHESMLYGTPTVSMPSENLKSRIVLGAYKQMKINDPPIVTCIDDYVQKAVEIANLDEKKMLETKRYYSENAKLFLFENDEAVKDLERIFLKLL